MIECQNCYREVKDEGDYCPECLQNSEDTYSYPTDIEDDDSNF